MKLLTESELHELIVTRCKVEGQKNVATELTIPQGYLSDICNKKRAISNGIARKFGYALGRSFAKER